MKYRNILYEKKDGIGTITLHRPDSMNALNSEVFRELKNILEKIESDDEVAVVIMTGSDKFLLQVPISRKLEKFPHP